MIGQSRNLLKRLLPLTYSKLITIQHISSLIDTVESHSKDDIRVSKDHIAFEFFDTFSGGLVQKGKISQPNSIGSLADDFYKDLYGDDKYEDILQEALKDDSDQEDYDFESKYF